MSSLSTKKYKSANEKYRFYVSERQVTEYTQGMFCQTVGIYGYIL